MAFTLLFHIRFTTETIAKAPSFLTTLGILGTFTGIAIGLMDFDSNDIQASVPLLIGGVKTAVWASAFGVFSALTIKLRDLLFRRRRTVQRKSKATVDDLLDSLQSMEATLGGVEQALVGETEPSLMLQLRHTQEEQAKTLNTFGESLTQFRDHLAESNTKVLVASLKEVITDFNGKLNEQFGENFKKLNEAAEQMVEWQKQYSEQMPTMIEQQKETAAHMREASEQYKSLMGDSERFTKVAESLSGLLEGLDQQRKELNGSLESLSTLVSSASKDLPQREGHIKALTDQLSEGVSTANEQFNTHVKDMMEQTKAQVAQLDHAMSEELTKALDSFGRQLASLSSKFAQDYGPITERLQDVLRIAKDGTSNNNA
jgi:chromosome segregation ATPase